MSTHAPTRHPRARATWTARVPIAPDPPATNNEPPAGRSPTAFTARNAVLPATGTAAASTKPRFAGTDTMRELARTAAYSAHVPPLGCMALTKAMRSPGRWARTALPTCSTTPAASIPIGSGYGASDGRKYASCTPTPTASTRTSSSSSSICGIATSAGSISSASALTLTNALMP